MLKTLERGRECYRRRAWAEAYQALSLADQGAPLGAEDLERLATSAYLMGRDAEFLHALDRAHHVHLKTGDSARAARAAFWLGLTLLLRGETGPATGWLARARRLLKGRPCVEQGYLLLPVAEQDLAEGNYDAAHANASDAAADRRAIQRRGPDRLRPTSAGSGPRVTGAGSDGARAAGRSDGGGHRGGALADHDRSDLLQRDRGVSAGVCGGPRPRVDVRPGAVVRAATRHGCLHRHLPRASRRDHAAPRCVAGRDRGGAARLRAGLARGSIRSRRRRRSTSRARCTACAERLRPPRRRTGTRAKEGGSRSRDSPCCGSPRAVPTRRPRRSAASLSATIGSARSARSCCRPTSRSCWPWARPGKRATRAASSRRSAARFDTGLLGAMAAHARGAVELAGGDAEAALGSLRRAWRGVAADRGALRGRTRARPDRTRLSRPRGRRRGQPGAGRGPDRVRAAGRRAGPRPGRRAHPARATGAHPGADAARAAGASPGRRRQDQQGHRRRACP